MSVVLWVLCCAVRSHIMHTSLKWAERQSMESIGEWLANSPVQQHQSTEPPKHRLIVSVSYLIDKELMPFNKIVVLFE